MIEDVVEENADEFDPHASFYDGCEDYPLKTEANCAPSDQTALVLAPPTKYHTMAVVPGKTREFLSVRYVGGEGYSVLLNLSQKTISYVLIARHFSCIQIKNVFLHPIPRSHQDAKPYPELFHAFHNY